MRSITYLYRDHLGSMVMVSDPSTISYQAFDSRSSLRSGMGDISQTTLDYTGQRKDDTGLLFYNVIYDDLALGRFI